MKKLLLALLLSLGLILCFTACTSSSDTKPADETKSEAEEEAKMEPPVSDVSGGTGIQGTWKAEELDGDNQEIVQLALNSDNTFVLYTGADSGENVDTATSIDGKYSYTDTELTLEPETEIAGEDPGVFKAGDDGKVVMKYTVNDTTLTLTNSDNEQEVLTRQ